VARLGKFWHGFLKQFESGRGEARRARAGPGRAGQGKFWHGFFNLKLKGKLKWLK
jgi:hypothetical protein